MNYFDEFDYYFDDFGEEVLINKSLMIEAVHLRDTKAYELRGYDFQSNAGVLEFKKSDQALIKPNDLIEINELKFEVEKIIDRDNGILVAVLSDYKASDGHIDFAI